MMCGRRATFLLSLAASLGFGSVGRPVVLAQQATTPLPPPASQTLAEKATIALAQHDGTLTAAGLHHPVQVLRDTWGVPHIYAQDTWDLFFAQGFVAAQDHMWQMEMWRRAGEGKLAEVLGPEYVQRDKFARLLAFRGDWNAELLKYNPDGPEIFSAFARGVNSAIEVAVEQQKVPIEFQLMGIVPEPSWTAKTVLTRMPAWTLSHNASSELARALAVKAYGVEKAEQLFPATPHKALEIPAGLNLDDIDPQILDIAKGSGSLNWKYTPPAKPASGGAATSSVVPVSPDSGSSLADLLTVPGGEADKNFDLGSNDWVVGGNKSATGMPLLSNDPHREVVNPALRMLVHLNAPGWNDIGVTEPGFPGISIGHNDDIAWGFTILGVDQQDIYVEETDPANPDRYMYKGEWKEMTHDRQLIHVKPNQFAPVVFDVKTTIHGPVLFEDKAKHRAYTLKWVGAEPGGAGYLGSLNVLQAKNWDEFRTDVAKSWYLPSHSLVYADTKGNYGYVAAALSPVRKNWDGLLPVPGKDGKYEWDGFVPLLDLPHQLNGGKGFYASANNDVVPKIFPNYKVPLGFEYSAPFRYDRIAEVLSENRKFSIEDMEQLQQDHMSLPARKLVPLFKGLASDKPDVQAAIGKLRAWNFVVDKNAPTPTIYEYWLLKLMPLIYAPHLPEEVRGKFNRYDVRNVIQWMTHPDKTLGSDPVKARNAMMVTALDQALTELHAKYGDDESKWVWGDIHEARFEHPLLNASDKSVFGIAPVRRGGDAYTVQATSNPTEKNADEEHGASAQFVMDVKDWDNSVALNTPGNSAQPGSPHYADLAPLWGDGKFFPLAFSKARVESVTKDRLTLYPEAEFESEGDNPAFERVQTGLFTDERPISLAWGDYDNDGWPDLFVGYFGGMVKLFHNDHGKFRDVTLEAGISDANAVRAAAWGDFDGDGNLDLYVGFAFNATTPNRLYKGDGHGHFVDVAEKMGVNDWGETRQTTFVDFNNDGRPDLFVAFREKRSRLYRNDGNHFTEVAEQMGITGARSTVGAVWFDYNEDGKLDLFEADQNGQANVVYRNDGDHFTEVGKQLGLDGGDRSVELGSVSIAVGDYNNDGRLDLFYANYGPSWLMRNDAPGKFTDVAAQNGVIVNRHLVSAGWGDFDNDGKIDLYTDGYLVGHPNIRDYLFHNEGDHFTDVTPGYMLKNDADHAVAWVDYDHDGAIDLILANHEVGGKLSLYHNLLPPEKARHSLQVLVLDKNGHYTKAGSEVRLYEAGTRKVLAAAQVDTGSSYDGQSAIPVHFGLGKDMTVDVEVTTMSNTGRLITRVEGVDTASLHGTPLTIRAK